MCQGGYEPHELLEEIEFELRQYYCEGGDPRARAARIVELFAEHRPEECRESVRNI
jgi:hypothetical protein